jgi:hypothetical protein
MGIAKPRQSLTGIVEAAEDRVWGALLETSPYLTPQMRETIADTPTTLRFPTGGTTGQASPVAGVNVESDTGQHTLAISGQWWFRGVWSMRPEGPATLVCYQAFNVAPAVTRWLVPLVAGPALRASARPQFEQTLAAIGSLLDCPVRVTG